MELREPSDASKAYHILAGITILFFVIALSVGLTLDNIFDYAIKALWAFVNPFMELCFLCVLARLLRVHQERVHVRRLVRRHLRRILDIFFIM